MYTKLIFHDIWYRYWLLFIAPAIYVYMIFPIWYQKIFQSNPLRPDPQIDWISKPSLSAIIKSAREEPKGPTNQLSSQLKLSSGTAHKTQEIKQPNNKPTFIIITFMCFL